MKLLYCQIFLDYGFNLEGYFTKEQLDEMKHLNHYRVIETIQTN